MSLKNQSPALFPKLQSSLLSRRGIQHQFVVKQWAVVCFGFSFAALTICAVYVNNTGKEITYHNQHIGRKPMEDLLKDMYVNGQAIKTTTNTTGVGTAAPKTSNKTQGSKLSVNVSSHVMRTKKAVEPKQIENPHKQQDSERNNSTDNGKGHPNDTQHLPHLNKSSDSVQAVKPAVSLGGKPQPVLPTPDPLYTHHGYIGVLDPKKKLNLHCTQCALVSSSGQLLQSRVGYLIDEADCVFRMNDAPVPGYEEDVGTRTTVRVIGHPATPNLRNKRRQLLQESSTRFVVGWGPPKPMKTTGTGYAYNNLKEMAKLFKDVGFFYLTQDQMNKADEIFEAETGRPRMGSGTYLSTGWFTMLLARASCDEIHVYGMVNDEYCQQRTNKNVPYHYYDPRGRKECDYYRTQEKGKKGFHRFMTEKSVFARWAREQPPIFFHQPDWNP